MPKSLLVDHLEVARRLAKSDGKVLASYFIEMAMDAVNKSEALDIDLTKETKRR